MPSMNPNMPCPCRLLLTNSLTKHEQLPVQTQKSTLGSGKPSVLLVPCVATAVNNWLSLCLTRKTMPRVMVRASSCSVWPRRHTLGGWGGHSQREGYLWKEDPLWVWESPPQGMEVLDWVKRERVARSLCSSSSASWPTKMCISSLTCLLPQATVTAALPEPRAEASPTPSWAALWVSHQCSEKLTNVKLHHTICSRVRVQRKGPTHCLPHSSAKMLLS